ncbi:MAG: HIRAN domain-containing protein [Planctomycetia bacterium]|nr:HIRAN domain-containing protein [Planctomycetia bacterium]
MVDVHIAGTNYVENIKDLEPGLKDGTKVHFFREQENEHDPLAIVIKDDQGNKLGYIPRRKNEILARLMDAGKLIYGTVFKKQQTGNWIKIELQVYLDD